MSKKKTFIKTRVIPLFLVIAIIVAVIFLILPIPILAKSSDDVNVTDIFMDNGVDTSATTEFVAEAVLYDRDGNPIGSVPTNNLALMTTGGVELGTIGFTLEYAVAGVDVDWDTLTVNYTQSVIVMGSEATGIYGDADLGQASSTEQQGMFTSSWNPYDNYASAIGSQITTAPDQTALQFSYIVTVTLNVMDNYGNDLISQRTFISDVSLVWSSPQADLDVTPPPDFEEDLDPVDPADFHINDVRSLFDESAGVMWADLDGDGAKQPVQVYKSSATGAYYYTNPLMTPPQPWQYVFIENGGANAYVYTAEGVKNPYSLGDDISSFAESNLLSLFGESSTAQTLDLSLPVIIVGGILLGTAGTLFVWFVILPQFGTFTKGRR